MGIEKQLVSSKMRAENIAFLARLSSQLEPYEVSFSSLVDLCVSIVRALSMQGDIVLNPAALQVLLRTKGLPRKEAPGLSLTPETPTQARLFFSRLRGRAVLGMAYRPPFYDFRRTFALRVAL